MLNICLFLQTYPACSICGENETCIVNNNNVHCEVTGNILNTYTHAPDIYIYT